jgi:hypothetical protein
MKHVSLSLRIIAFLVLAVSAIAASAQAYTPDSMVAASSSSADRAALVEMTFAQQNRSAVLPFRLITSSGIDRVTYLTIFQSRSSQVPDVVNLQSAKLPATSAQACTPEFYCEGWSLGPYLVNEFPTYALARTFASALDPRSRPHVYGPLATPKGNFIVVYPDIYESTSQP